MENASKALIIAGSIIVSLVIVSLGIVIYRKVQSSTDVSGVNIAQVEGHNEEYENYFGTYKSAADVKALLQRVKTNNTLWSSTNGNDSSTLKIWVIYNGEAATDKMTGIINKISQSKHYAVNVYNEETSDDEENNTDNAGYHKNGYIRTITISLASGNKS